MMDIPEPNGTRQAYRPIRGVQLFALCQGCGHIVILSEMTDRGPARVRGGVAINRQNRAWDIDVHNVDPLCKKCHNEDVALRNAGKTRKSGR